MRQAFREYCRGRNIESPVLDGFRYTDPGRMPRLRSATQAGCLGYGISNLLVKRGIEGAIAWAEVQTFGELAGFFGTKLAIHTRVFPLDAERALILGLIECANDLFEVHAATSWTTEVPTASRIAKVNVAGQDTALAVERGDRILDVHVIDAIRECTNKLNWVNALPNQVTWIEIETELFSMSNGFESSLGGVNVEGDFSWVNFECEFNTAFAKHIEDGIEAFSEQFEARVNHLFGNWWEGVQQMPNA